eukprot:gene29204-35252_t
MCEQVFGHFDGSGDINSQFLAFNIDTIVLQPVYNSYNAKSNIYGIEDVYEVIMQALHMSNNLEEELHHSIFYYLLLDNNTFVGITEYGLPLGLGLVSFIVMFAIFGNKLSSVYSTFNIAIAAYFGGVSILFACLASECFDGMRTFASMLILVACAAWMRKDDAFDFSYAGGDDNEGNSYFQDIEDAYTSYAYSSRDCGESNATRNLFYNMIGGRLYKIVGNMLVLSFAVKVQQQKPSSLRFGCTGYDYGGDLARTFRGNSNTNTTIIPTLVDTEQNKMCFLMATPADSQYDQYLDRNKALYHEPLPPILKLEESVYQVIEDGADEFFQGLPDSQHLQAPSPLDLKVFFRPEAFEHILNPYSGSFDFEYIYKHYKIALEKVAIYDEKSNLDHFLFSAHDREDFFVEHCRRNYYCDESAKLPCERREKWARYRRVVNELAHGDNLDSRYGERIPEYDPCHYESLFQNVEYTEHYVRMPLESLAKISDELTRSSCLANIVSMFAEDLGVSFIAIEPRPETLSYHARSITQSAQVNPDLSRQPYTAAGLRGDNQVVGISDTGLDVNNCFFYDSKGRVQPTSITSPRYDPSYRKVVQYLYNGCGDSNDEEAGHGTHVSGIAVGNINGKDIGTDGKYDGVAPNAKVSFADLSKSGAGLCIPPVSQLYPTGKAAGARVFSNSWGTYFSSGTGSYYGQDMDTWLYQNMDSTVFFAAGNVGNVRSITRESSSKNVISVGSSHTTLGSSNITYVAFYSSRGPVYDNRFKPDIVSPGHQLNAARASGTTSQTCDTVTYTGTSMATPAAAGVALMVRQYFLDSRFWP